MGVLPTSVTNPVKPPQQDDEEKVLEAEDEAPAAQKGAAHVLASGVCLVTKVLLLMMAGALIGVALASLLRLILPRLMGLYEAEGLPKRAHLHMVTTNLTVGGACAIEALASKHANRTCNLVLLQQHPAKVHNLVSLLEKHYPNLKTHLHPDVDEYFESSPLEGFETDVEPDLLELAARVLALWRHGGASVDLKRPVLDQPLEKEVVHRSAGALLHFPQPCHPALQGLLTTLGKGSTGSAAEVVEQATSWMCRPPAGAEDPFLPKHCLGVHVVTSKIEPHEQLQCPLVRTIHTSFDPLDQLKNFEEGILSKFLHNRIM
ncbi:uncharacterized protein LOC132196946 [Neocloeon triangulifer]|uniref:uncharacterized protein LOC132196946 n=1 Tax=Neocloeon triangulifer TaxID=2078957 RepID=UPI00286F23D8|nr:uncharacterized protein LOC132196946 [Neocloeon triangulifer]